VKTLPSQWALVPSFGVRPTGSVRQLYKVLSRGNYPLTILELKELKFQHPAILTLITSYRTRSIPSNFSSETEGPFILVQTASLPMTTPLALAPISAPHNHAGLLRITACVASTCSTMM
jgi:hypothetical protein